MTNIIIQIENANDETRNTIKEKCHEIAETCQAYAMNKKEMKNDDFRNYLEKNDNEMFLYLYDEIGAKNKPVMSRHKLNISSGMVAIGNNSGMFISAHDDDCNDFDYESRTESFSKYKSEMNKIEKALDNYALSFFTSSENELTETDETETDETETDETETDETLPEKTTLEQIYDVVEKLKLSDRVELRDFINETIETEQKELKQANG